MLTIWCGIVLSWSLLLNAYLLIRLHTNRKALQILLTLIALEVEE
jgi:hypothetical protein